MEYHPRINRYNPIINQHKIILGSFPTWSITDPDPEKNETVEQKESERTKNGDLPFYYGSALNEFWHWYKEFVDQKVSKENIRSIQASLNAYAIGITDIIISCTRKDRSASDKHLTMRTYNHQFIKYPNRNETVKILCTSKGVMNEMLLNEVFFKLHSKFKVNLGKSHDFEKRLMQKINGKIKLVKKPIYRLIDVESGGIIECISIPSPGSPYRRLIDFGFSSNNFKKFLNDYLHIAFNWFIS